ncbi:MAG: D-alanyl-D-alanine carboxypeptidase [Erysipelotrichaceae bacterium]|nr:D-alanyl-D-alanine carboxypeptidase [Erysipelotrichaceae bacterium]
MKVLLKLGLILFLCIGIVPVQAEEKPEIESDYVLLYDLDTHQVLWDKNSSDQIYPASLTKMMTLIVAIENIADTRVKILVDSQVMAGLIEAGASRAGYYEGDEVPVIDLMHGILLPSGAECCNAVAFHVAGSIEGYVEMMNAKAQELGMEHTHFVNTTGLHDDNHYTTLQDLQKLFDYCLQNPLFYSIFSTSEYKGEATLNYPEGLSMRSTVYKYMNDTSNPYYREIDGFVGSKSGFTYEAEYCFAAVAQRDGVRYGLLTAHAYVERTIPSHFLDAATIFNHYFDYYEKRSLLSSEEYVGEAKVNFNLSHKSTSIYPERDVALIVDKDNTEVIYKFPEELDAPLQKGQVVGSATILSDGEVVDECNLVVRQTIGRNVFLYIVETYPLGVVSLLGILLLLLIGLLILANRRRRRRRRRRKH